MFTFEVKNHNLYCIQYGKFLSIFMTRVSSENHEIFFKKKLILLRVRKSSFNKEKTLLFSNNNTYNPGHNILELYNILEQIRFTTSKRKLDIQYSKLGNQETLEKAQIWVDTQPSVQSPFKNLEFENSSPGLQIQNTGEDENDLPRSAMMRQKIKN